MKKMSILDAKLEYKVFITPDFVYIPIHAKKIAFSENSYVYDSTLLLVDDNKKNVYSSCSGTLIGTAHVMTTNGRMNSMVIENDFLERKKTGIGTKKRIFKLSSKEMESILENFNLNYGFKDKETLIIHLSYDKNSILNDATNLKENIVELLEVTDALVNAFDISKVVFAVNEEDNDSHGIISDFIGTYHNFSLITTKYNAFDKEKTAKKYFGKDKEKYTLISLCDLSAISNALKSKRLLKNKFVTVSGGSLKKPIIVYTKIGACASEILNFLKIVPEKNEIKLVGSCTQIVSKNEAVVTRDLEAIILSK